MAYGNLPLSFEANAAQTASEVKFLSHGRDYRLYLTPTEAVMTLSRGDAEGAEMPKERLDPEITEKLNAIVAVAKKAKPADEAI